MNHIPNATIPVLKAVTNSSYQSRKIDITVQDGKHTGLKCVDLVKDYLKQFEVLHTLVVAFKQLIYSCQMNDPYLGGMTSYALILVLVAFLQVRLQFFPRKLPVVLHVGESHEPYQANREESLKFGFTKSGNIVLGVYAVLHFL